MGGRLCAASCANVCRCGIDCRLSRIGFGRRGKQNRRIRQRNARLGHAERNGRFTGGSHNGNRLRIGKPHILGGNHLQPTHGGKQLPRLQKACQIKDRRIRVGAAYGFLQTGQQVVVRPDVEAPNPRQKVLRIRLAKHCVGCKISILQEPNRTAHIALAHRPDSPQKGVIGCFLRVVFAV